jgi:hypothetical protein
MNSEDYLHFRQSQPDFYVFCGVSDPYWFQCGGSGSCILGQCGSGIQCFDDKNLGKFTVKKKYFDQKFDIPTEP